MGKQEGYENNKEYIETQGLDKLIDFKKKESLQERVFDSVSGKLSTPFPPEACDLVRLHKMIRQRKCFTVMEFGCGYSTVIMADALEKNKEDWEKLTQKPQIRNNFMFKLFSIDASAHWIRAVKKRFPAHLSDRVQFRHSGVEVGLFNGQLCHYYKNLPDIVADLIYLDGPCAKDVKGSINGLSFKCEERTVMSADLLLMESTFLPGTFIAVDGRTNNARFLQRNFTRNYEVKWDKAADFTTFELNEERLGKYNVLGSDFF